MTNSLNQFIKRNAELINQEAFTDLYEDAYEWLSDDDTAELTKMLTKALNVDAETYARDLLIEKFNLELNNFKVEKNYDTLSLASFVRRYMNHIMGIDFYEFAQMVELFLKKYPVKGISTFDDGFDLYLKHD